MGDIDESDAQTAVHLLQLHLHILTHLQVERGKRFIEKQHFRLVYDSTGNSHPLLLASRKRIHITVFVIGHPHHAQRRLHFPFHVGTGHFLQFQSESDVVIHVQVREQGIFLKHGINRTAVRRSLCHLVSANVNLAFRSRLESRQQTEQRGLSTSRRPQNGKKLALADIQVDMVERGLLAEIFGYVLYFNNRSATGLHNGFNFQRAKVTNIFRFHITNQ